MLAAPCDFLNRQGQQSATALAAAQTCNVGDVASDQQLLAFMHHICRV